MSREQDVERIEMEFKKHLITRYPNMDDYTFGIVFDAFQKGFAKGTALTFNAYSKDVKLCVFDDDYFKQNDSFVIKPKTEEE